MVSSRLVDIVITSAGFLIENWIDFGRALATKRHSSLLLNFLSPGSSSRLSAKSINQVIITGFHKAIERTMNTSQLMALSSTTKGYSFPRKRKDSHFYGQTTPGVSAITPYIFFLSRSQISQVSHMSIIRSSLMLLGSASSFVQRRMYSTDGSFESSLNPLRGAFDNIRWQLLLALFRWQKLPLLTRLVMQVVVTLFVYSLANASLRFINELLGDVIQPFLGGSSSGGVNGLPGPTGPGDPSPGHMVPPADNEDTLDLPSWNQLDALHTTIEELEGEANKNTLQEEALASQPIEIGGQSSDEVAYLLNLCSERRLQPMDPVVHAENAKKLLQWKGEILKEMEARQPGQGWLEGGARFIKGRSEYSSVDSLRRSLADIRKRGVESKFFQCYLKNKQAHQRNGG